SAHALAIEARERGPLCRIELRAFLHRDLEPALCDAPALLLHLLALVGAKAREQLVEARVALVVPMELEREPRREARRTRAIPLRLREEEQVQRGGPDLVGRVECAADQRARDGLLVLPLRDEKAPPRRG